MSMSSFPPGPSLGVEELHREYFMNTFPFLHKCFEEYGDVFSLDLGTFGSDEFAATGRWVFLSRAEDIERLFKADNQQVFAGEANQIQFMKLVPSRSSTACDGDEHLRRRKLLLKYFKQVETHTEAMAKVATDVIQQMPRNEAFSILDYFKQMTYGIIFDTTMGSYGDAATREACAPLMNLDNPAISIPDKHAMLHEIHVYLRDKIQEDRAHLSVETGQQNDCVYHYQLGLRDNEQYVVTNEEMADEILSLLMGGISTTAVMLSWAVTFILSNESVAQRLKQELDDKLVKTDEQHVSQLAYLENVILETLRIQPFMATPGIRLLKTEFEIAGYVLPAGTLVANCSYLLQQRPEYYPEPDSFCPQRFEKETVKPYQWTPFGGGVRRCVGYSFAQHSMKVVLACLFSQTSISLAMPVDGAEFLGAFFGPKGGPSVIISG